MKLTILVDNHTLIDRYFYGEPAVSYYIEDGDTRILFDVGYSDVFLRNAHKMRIRLDAVAAIVISHGHNDHTGGLFHLIQHYTGLLTEHGRTIRPKLIAHPAAFLDKYEGQEVIGSLLKEAALTNHFQLALSKTAVWLTDKLVFLGEITRRNDFENKIPVGRVKQGDSEQADFLLDDSALAYKSAQGLVIITACSHAGICNIIEQAKRICQEDRIADIIGGFHLLNPDAALLRQTCDYIRANRVQALHPCHCTDWQSKLALSAFAAVQEAGVGLVLEYE